MRIYKLRKLDKATREKLEGEIKLQPVYRNYSAKMAQHDLDRPCKGFYTIDGDTYRGYEIMYDGEVVVKHFSPRELVLLTVDLYRHASDE